MRRMLMLSLVAPLTMSCESTHVTESPSGLPALSQMTHGADLLESVLVVGNFTPGSPANSVLRFDGGGHFIDVLTDLALPDGARGGCCMTFGPDENLYVSAGGGGLAGHINRFNGVTGELIDAFVPSGPSGPIRPLTVVFGPDGNLYVGDIGPHSIRRYDGRTGANLDADGHFVDPGVFGPTGPQLFTFGADGKLYIVAPANLPVVPDFYGAVRRFDPATAQIEDFVTGTITEPINSGLTVGPDGNLYVGAGNGVNRYDGLTGASLGAFVSQGSGGLGIPVGMVFGPDGNFYVANPGTTGDGNVLRYDGQTGAFLDAFVSSSEPRITAPRIIEFKSRITMCHRPPGNPANQQTISTGYLTAGDHVRHGDLVGACPWSPPVHLGSMVNSSGADLEVAVSRDGLSLYIASNRSGNFDIWVSQRKNSRDDWGPPQSIDAINTAAREQGPYLSRDGRDLYFFSDRPGAAGLDLYVARRSGTHDDFGWEAPVNLGSGVNSAANETLPVLFEDDVTGVTTLYFSANAVPPGEIYASVRQLDGTFGPREVVRELSSARRDRVLAIRYDGLEIFLASDRPGPAPTPFDLWVATRATTSDPWSVPVNLGPSVNTTSDEGGAALAFDGTTLYFTSDRTGGLGNHDIWMTTRARRQP